MIKRVELDSDIFIWFRGLQMSLMRDIALKNVHAAKPCRKEIQGVQLICFVACL
jgi:hypothetical protein